MLSVACLDIIGIVTPIITDAIKISYYLSCMVKKIMADLHFLSLSNKEIKVN